LIYTRGEEVTVAVNKFSNVHGNTLHLFQGEV